MKRGAKGGRQFPCVEYRRPKLAILISYKGEEEREIREMNKWEGKRDREKLRNVPA
jgi:hypothetical protein